MQIERIIDEKAFLKSLVWILKWLTFSLNSLQTSTCIVILHDTVKICETIGVWPFIVFTLAVNKAG